jgi:hypothetical protein
MCNACMCVWFGGLSVSVHASGGGPGASASEAEESASSDDSDADAMDEGARMDATLCNAAF